MKSKYLLNYNRFSNSTINVFVQFVFRLFLRPLLELAITQHVAPPCDQTIVQYPRYICNGGRHIRTHTLLIIAYAPMLSMCRSCLHTLHPPLKLHFCNQSARVCQFSCTVWIFYYYFVVVEILYNIIFYIVLY